MNEAFWYWAEGDEHVKQSQLQRYQRARLVRMVGTRRSTHSYALIGFGIGSTIGLALWLLLYWGIL